MTVAFVLLAAAVAAPEELPLPPFDFETAPPAAPVPVRTIEPPATAPPPRSEVNRTPLVVAPPEPVAGAPATTSDASAGAGPSSKRLFFDDSSWLRLGHASAGLRLTPLNGGAALLTDIALALTLGDFDLGLNLVSGSANGAWTTFAGPSLAWEFAHEGPIDLALGTTFGVGAAGTASASTALVAWTPEFSAKLRLLPFVRVFAAASYRFTNVWSWTGPAGDAFGGFAFGAGLEFGTFQE